MGLVHEHLFHPGEKVEFAGRPAWGEGVIVRMTSFDEGIYRVRWLRADPERVTETEEFAWDLAAVPS